MEKIEKLEAEARRLRRAVFFQGVLLATVVMAWLIASVGIGHASADKSEVLDSLTVRELVVVDEADVARVRIGGQLPQLVVVDGKTIDRGSESAGVLLYDSTGQERSGYVTWEEGGHVGLTLDTRKGQVALLAAGPEEGAVIRLWHGDEDAISLRSDSAGSRLTAMKDGNVAFQQPAVESVPTDACTEYRNYAGPATREQVIQACKERFPEAACMRCLEEE